MKTSVPKWLQNRSNLRLSKFDFLVLPDSPLQFLHAYEVMHACWHAHIHVTPLLKILASDCVVLSLQACDINVSGKISEIPQSAIACKRQIVCESKLLLDAVNDLIACCYVFDICYTKGIFYCVLNTVCLYDVFTAI